MDGALLLLTLKKNMLLSEKDKDLSVIVILTGLMVLLTLKYGKNSASLITLQIIQVIIQMAFYFIHQ